MILRQVNKEKENANANTNTTENELQPCPLRLPPPHLAIRTHRRRLPPLPPRAQSMSEQTEPTTTKNCRRGERLVDTLEWRDRLALSLIERVGDDTAVLDLNLRRFDVVLPSESVLHPVLVIALSRKPRRQSRMRQKYNAQADEPLSSPHGRGRHETLYERQQR